MIVISKIRYIQRLLTTRQISCVELTREYLSCIEKKNKKLNAYVNVTDEEALKNAKIVDERLVKGEMIMSLEGIPMSLKDNIVTKDIETTCCSKMLKGYVPIFDATVYDVLKKQNAILLGKTNMDEFAMGSTTETSCFGPSLNPYNIKHVAGGSSGGAASSVAGNMAVYGLASDTGGSIRQPASFCGLVGLKPTYGMISRYGLVAYASSFDTIGVITSGVEDAAIVYDSISIYDRKDSTSIGSKITTSDKLNNKIKGIKIGIVKEFYRNLNEDVQKAMDESIKIYEKLGAEIVTVSMPQISYSLPVYYIIACAEASSNLGRYDGIRYGYKTKEYSSIDEMICKTRSEGFGKEVKRRIMLGTYVLSSGYYDYYYKKAQNLRASIISGFKEVFEICDVILAPTVPETAFRLSCNTDNPVDMYSTDICTVSINIAGLPAVSLPCGFDKQGLPIGMQLIGNKFEEHKILNVAYNYEELMKDKIHRQLNKGVRP